MLRLGKLALVCVVGFSALTGCENLTTQPVCNESNAAVFEGISGTYYLASLDEEFNRTVEIVNVIVDSENKARFKVRSKKSNSELELAACRIGSHDVIEAHNPDVGLYAQAKLSVTNVGLQFSPFYYDRAQLTEYGIPSSVLEYDAKALVKRFLNLESGPRSLVIDNSKVDGKGLLPLSVQGPYSINLIRK